MCDNLNIMKKNLNDTKYVSNDSTLSDGMNWYPF